MVSSRFMSSRTQAVYFRSTFPSGWFSILFLLPHCHRMAAKTPCINHINVQGRYKGESVGPVTCVLLSVKQKPYQKSPNRFLSCLSPILSVMVSARKQISGFPASEVEGNKGQGSCRWCWTSQTTVSVHVEIGLYFSCRAME